MKIFFDTEFVEDGKTIDPLSLGFSTQDNDGLYIVIEDQDPLHTNWWVDKNVRPYLGETVGGIEPIYAKRADAGKIILDWVSGKTNSPEFWAYYADYDWVLFCQLYGRMLDLPPGWPMLCMDFKQSNPKSPLNTPIIEHHAYGDAEALMRTYYDYRID